MRLYPIQIDLWDKTIDDSVRWQCPSVGQKIKIWKLALLLTEMVESD